MKTTPATKVKRDAGLRPEYAFDYSKAKSNRFAGKGKDTVVVMLDPDVSRVFKDGASVNSVLRSLIGSMPLMQKSARSRT